MPILEGDIKLLKSAVMADTSDGGGAMTGVAVIDGQSNNLFPDTSEMDRALGRVAMRKVFGVAHTSDTDVLLGAHAVITDAPDDPLVHCTLMSTPGWSDERDVAKDAIEKYLVKGPRLQARMLDTHYAGSLILRLYTPNTTGDFPTGGDAVVLRTPAGVEQYVRILKTTITVGGYTSSTGSQFTATVVACDLGQALAYDFVGAPMDVVVGNEVALYASVYTTTIAAGTRFYGIKPLSVPAEVGDTSATTAGGIFTPLVPAATIETPIIDIFPLTGRGAVIATGYGPISIAGTAISLAPNATVKAPTCIKPASVTLTHNATSFTDDGTGNLLQGTTAVGSVDYGSGIITFLPGSPSYGSAAITLTYTPASSASAAAFSSEFMVTTANQGLAYTTVFSPPPAPGSFTLSYMAQGRWYDLTDNNVGKLSGTDVGYGVGTLSYTSGSMAVTLGALPDIGSALIADWGDPSSARQIDITPPARLQTTLWLGARTTSANISVSWSRGGTNYTATSDAGGTLSGSATGNYASGSLVFEPGVFPEGAITVNHKFGAATTNGFYVGSTGGGYTSVQIRENSGAELIDPPVRAGTVSFTLPISYSMNVHGYTENALRVYDSAGALHATYSPYGKSRVVIVGTIDYATGVMQLLTSFVMRLQLAETTYGAGGWYLGGYKIIGPSDVVITPLIGGIGNFSAVTGLDSDEVTVFETPSWGMALDAYGSDKVLNSNTLFKIGADVYSAVTGVVRRGWNPSTGAPTTVSAGVLTSGGDITITSLPSDNVNAVTWYNAAQDAAGKGAEHGVYRTASAPLKTGVMQMLYGAETGVGNDAGVISGFFTGTVDYVRGIVRWDTVGYIDPAQLSYNAVFLQYLPLEAALLGLETARLPLDGKVPIYRAGGLVIVHNTQTYALPNPLVKGTVYDVGRVRIAAVKVLTATGTTVDTALYTTDLDAGTITFPVGSDLTGLVQPFAVDHRIEDMVVCSVADISGKLTFTRNLTHNYPANTSYASSVLAVGDVFARAHNFVEQATWTGVWSDALVGSAPLANFNETSYPLVVTNKGAITERWALIFTNTTTFNIVGESVGNVGTGNTATDCAPINPATGVPYFSIPATGWGNGWAVGNVYRFNTAACGAPIWVVRTVLQGPATLQDDKFTLAFRGDVDRP